MMQLTSYSVFTSIGTPQRLPRLFFLMMWTFLRRLQLSTRSKTYLPVADFYAGKSVFITGGTGFLGKVFIQRILETCNEVDKIYVLVREKKDASIEKRIQNIVNNPIFSNLNDKRPKAQKKIIPIAGDLQDNNLGIKFEDTQMLTETVSVVFHAAATVKFHESLETAMSINVEGTRKVLELCQRMKNLQAFVYVSTAYSNTDKDVIEEVVYPPPGDIDDVYKFLQGNNDIAEERRILNGRPNSYTFTKAMAESYVADNCGGVPTVIIRPSMVTSIAKAPVAGWLDNWYGATEFIYNIGVGLNRVVLGDGRNVSDLIPVDYVANLAIVAATRCHRSNEVIVYNSASSSVNPVTSGQIYQIFIDETIKGGPDVLYYPMVFYSKSSLMVKLLTFLLMTSPACMADLWLFTMGKPRRHMETIRHVIGLRDALNYFATNSWLMKADNVRLLSSSLSASDRQIFPCDPSDIDWPEYLMLFSDGVRKYLTPRHEIIKKCENLISKKNLDSK